MPTPCCPNPTASLPPPSAIQTPGAPWRNGRLRKRSDRHQEPDEESSAHRGQYQLNGGMVHVDRLLLPGLFESLHIFRECRRYARRAFSRGCSYRLDEKCLWYRPLRMNYFLGSVVNGSKGGVSQVRMLSGRITGESDEIRLTEDKRSGAQYRYRRAVKKKGACPLRCHRGDRNVVAFSGLTTMGTSSHQPLECACSRSLPCVPKGRQTTRV